MAAPVFTNLSPLSTEPEIKNLSGYPRLKPAYILKVKVTTGRPVGTILSGSNLIHWETGSGTLTTAEGYDHPVEANVEYGSDWLVFDPDGGHARPELKLLARTDDGVVLDCGYTGVARASQPILDMFEKDPNAKTFPFGISSTVHTFRTGNPKYKHLENKTFVGNGRFVITQNPFSITVESRISEVIPSCDMD
ncbi:uncharacterized protein BHQ10_009535 [Talaromyces amestolkiae]|uniref:Uncharacterized protein n=1 Tax=Talaromyces amestolkiae TaxID=1196081 RepID=A0A364LCM0_TALAM|nr:uncharacterized protein BHQ10_009535 [Talaromyces amestolkiae]RAO73523.1 hypothetical protein BHQ10_009535 [Talaromyces amestolkiae]